MLEFKLKNVEIKVSVIFIKRGILSLQKLVSLDVALHHYTIELSHRNPLGTIS